MFTVEVMSKGRYAPLGHACEVADALERLVHKEVVERPSESITSRQGITVSTKGAYKAGTQVLKRGHMVKMGENGG